MAWLKVMNPVARFRQQRIEPAQRLGNLSGKTIGLYWNMKAGGDMALERTAELLKRRYPDLSMRYYQGVVGQNVKHLTAEGADLIAKECHAVVGTTAD